MFTQESKRTVHSGKYIFARIMGEAKENGSSNGSSASSKLREPILKLSIRSLVGLPFVSRNFRVKVEIFSKVQTLYQKIFRRHRVLFFLFTHPFLINR